MAAPRSLDLLKEWLSQKQHAVQQLEAEAQTALLQRDGSLYTQRMHEKARLLAALAQEGTVYSASLEPGLQAYVNDTLAVFSASAQKSLELDSVFYMSALLYPEDHNPDTPDDLQLFIKSLEHDSILK